LTETREAVIGKFVETFGYDGVEEEVGVPDLSFRSG